MLLVRSDTLVLVASLAYCLLMVFFDDTRHATLTVGELAVWNCTKVVGDGLICAVIEQVIHWSTFTILTGTLGGE